MNSSSAQNDIKYVCIREMRDRVNGDGTISFTEWVTQSLTSLFTYNMYSAQKVSYQFE